MMKTCTFVLATLAAIAIALPSVASAREKHHRGMTSHHEHHDMGHGKPKKLQHRMHNHMVE
jgi:hypothetical protein